MSEGWGARTAKAASARRRSGKLPGPGEVYRVTSSCKVLTLGLTPFHRFNYQIRFSDSLSGGQIPRNARALVSTRRGRRRCCSLEALRSPNSACPQKGDHPGCAQVPRTTMPELPFPFRTPTLRIVTAPDHRDAGAIHG